MSGKVVDLGLLHEDELGVVASYTACATDVRSTPDVGLAVAFVVELLYPLFGDSIQLLDLAEHDGVGREGFGAAGSGAVALPMEAGGALKGAAVVGDRGMTP